MRLIDADALEELFREVIGGIAKKQEMNGNLEHMVRASAMVIEMIKDAPTIEPERKKGRWERHYARPGVYADLLWHCSSCQFKTAENYAPLYYHFCPNCGADMREVEHETDNRKK